MTLRHLRVGTSAIIKNVNLERLKSLGFVIGATVTLLRRTRSCLHVRIGLTEWALRESTADFVNIFGVEQ
jgi:Fe2+ transport system protein FeoA